MFKIVSDVKDNPNQIVENLYIFRTTDIIIHFCDVAHFNHHYFRFSLTYKILNEQKSLLVYSYDFVLCSCSILLLKSISCLLTMAANFHSDSILAASASARILSATTLISRLMHLYKKSCHCFIVLLLSRIKIVTNVPSVTLQNWILTKTEKQYQFFNCRCKDFFNSDIKKKKIWVS